MNITITPAAQKFMRRMVMFNGGGGGQGLRLLVSAGGCSGLSAEFTVEAEPPAGDAVVELGDVRVFLPAESRLLLEGVTIDFVDTPMNNGLSFINPNAGACACSGAAPAPAGSGAVSVTSITRKSGAPA